MSDTTELDAHPLCQVARVLTWGALVLFAYGALSWLVARPWFALTTLEVKTPVAHVTEAQIRLVAERRVRGTFFTVDLERVRESLEKLPWVREARVERRWPDTLVVSLVEHVPLARWNDEALVDREGGVFVAAVSGKLPRLWGPEDASADVVTAFLRLSQTLAPLGFKIDELRLSPRRAWRMRLDSGMQIALGRDHTDARLARFVALYPRLFGPTQAADGTPVVAVAPRAIDLRYPDGFAVRMPDNRQPASFAPRPPVASPLPSTT
ncbi:MAG: cell division protein FtsQ [Hydrogenophilales bacterium 16-64-46]|nr:MAG: cell division protein FtsQ [Hydrogenophilales bacterium 12-64-13]OYZ06657.1 MAG: cell division protein FtsQ [Hydrogenophilales bacterium 16-64-46]OZA39365.1 MAG: cell division protein FtsQ [Hydrogenophilales bacterium 17-64-34]HQT01325.1 cell division protein FtsQ/DivIB [Thiobacillus sp.]